MQIGSVSVKMGGIAGVWTHPDHRKKGYASQAMWDGIALMEKEGCDMSILFGIADFYHRYGFAVAFAEQSMTLSTQALQKLSGPYRGRTAKPTDLLAIRRLYRRYNAGRSGMDVRPTDWMPRWYMPRLGEGTTRRAGQVVVVCDGQDRVRGYAVYDAQAERMVVAEVCGTDHKALMSIGGVLARRALRAKVEHIRFCLPVDDPFVHLCVPLGCEVRAGYPFNSGAMGRIVRLNSLIKKMIPVFEERVKKSQLTWRGVLGIETDIGRVGLRIGPSGVAISSPSAHTRIKVNQMVLTQMVMGYRGVFDVVHDRGVDIPKQILPVVDVLFPRGNPYMWWTDRF
jgi:predicted acetyltransferase